MARSWKKILSLLDEMRSQELEFNEFTCSMVLSACGRERLLDEALKFFSGLLGLGPLVALDVIALKIKFKSYVNRVFLEMKNSGFEPDRDTFNTLISAYGRYGSAVNVSNMYNEMVTAGFSPSVTTYNALLNVLSRKGDWRGADVNVFVGETDNRMMMTGMHTVADIFCVGCGSIVGWKYEFAQDRNQKYKEGKFILELFKVLSPDGGHYVGNNYWQLIQAQGSGGSSEGEE
ncbi:hypothetical protein GIB67_027454 [Kingdonia uniflora]|uniref:Yippee domain-containing protein n=1 Tax=Kingdonia uniflora TaxID=39325 RepID=A0A7J7MFF5_9MAGN|nr:hypothetical protein GIB67_027454 [Kingdonia uniflora]